MVLSVVRWRGVRLACVWRMCALLAVSGCGATTAAGGDPGADAVAADALLGDVAALDADDAVTTDTTGGDTALVDVVADVAVSDVPSADVGLVDTAPDVAVDALSDAAADAVSDAAADAGPTVQCAGAPAAFPSFDRSCAQDSDCAVAIHQINCCGSHLAWGIQASALAAFTAAEATCDAQYPKCGCPAFQTMAEDGFGTFDSTAFAARCDAGTCRSFVPGAKAECTSSGMTAPLPVKTCASDNDCAVVQVMVDCCGSQQAIGIAKFAAASFSAAQAICAKGGAVCDCMPLPTTQEDGKPLVLDGSVGCVAGQCKTGIW